MPKTVSVIVPVTERVNHIADLLKSYHSALNHRLDKVELVVVLDGKFAPLEQEIREQAAEIDDLKVISLTRVYGESVALAIGIQRAEHEVIMTLPSYAQVESSSLPDLFDQIDEADVVVACRWPRKDSRVNRAISGAFHFLLRWITETSFRDIGCGVRVFKKQIFSELSIYGDQHRFLPVLADRRGFKVAEVEVPQAAEDLGLRLYSPRIYVSRLLDLIGVFFIARFTKKPLRFFGMVGSILGFVGVVILSFLVLQRFGMGIAMADRPILLLGSLCLVLGAQLFALGLVGELIIFTNAKNSTEYAVAETRNIESDQRE